MKWRRGPNNPAWRDSTQYWALHSRVRRARGAAKLYPCTHCGGAAQEWARIHEKDGRDPADYMPLCKMCHVHYDGPATPPHRSGEANGSAKLTWAQVHQIRALSSQVTQQDLAAMYDVSRMTIYRIQQGQSWVENQPT